MRIFFKDHRRYFIVFVFFFFQEPTDLQHEFVTKMDLQTENVDFYDILHQNLLEQGIFLEYSIKDFQKQKHGFLTNIFFSRTKKK